MLIFGPYIVPGSTIFGKQWWDVPAYAYRKPSPVRPGPVTAGGTAKVADLFCRRRQTRRLMQRDPQPRIGSTEDAWGGGGAA